MGIIYDNYELDILSNFYNVDYSLENFKNLFYKSLYGYNSLSIIPVRISSLKHYNYVLGYEYGDMILKVVMERIRHIIKGYGHVHKFGGDTLLIILHEKCKDKVTHIIEKIINDFNELVKIKEKKIRIFFNIGIVRYPEDSKEINTIFKYTEVVLDYIKKNYENKYEFFNKKMIESYSKKWEYEKDILTALDSGQFEIYYQSIVDISKNSICSFEALLRWNHPRRGILNPLEFIDILESNGLIIDVGKFVFREVCNEIKNINKLANRDISICINISEKQLSDKTFLDFIDETLKETGVEGKYIKFEITERCMVKSTEKILNILKQLKNREIGIIIDDFGTKYSSLNYLCDFPISGLKIDKSFINKISNSYKEFIVIKNVVQLSKELGIEVVAEGVESKRQLEILKNIHCNKIQGFIFSKPFPRKEFYKIQFN
ncbi:diguanylate cyclase (GGDEF)-like protein [Clostridium tetanomorphum]|uniref:EAL domain-containing protein n=1 Tax=Clostridium tetanomorphum TaxID=1553 RepID=A0A923J184_CLOTT|nr:GGDEF domain-containing phosphodiesterase [Clostridium tetanomorphum]KAJ52984.1 sensory transduction protein [Clostridium tetanomorphum DSM 665]MBC2398514.1 EAL domain-containing protein [Clostridium tetanomorphum]MBP1864924.1 diguanylate cyclase (GGDEF)-like protein [Clostridium tetanomorphum]NRS83130.1 diguanylate cyclase (GGDEF)-like protein [Clostridium tetanomorphum]NRZ98769.1 diguanylate cyclase (GGDEF)-like protein [Clostridium tetanomorphum]